MILFCHESFQSLLCLGHRGKVRCSYYCIFRPFQSLSLLSDKLRTIGPLLCPGLSPQQQVNCLGKLSQWLCWRRQQIEKYLRFCISFWLSDCLNNVLNCNFRRVTRKHTFNWSAKFDFGNNSENFITFKSHLDIKSKQSCSINQKMSLKIGAPSKLNWGGYCSCVS